MVAMFMAGLITRWETIIPAALVRQFGLGGISCTASGHSLAELSERQAELILGRDLTWAASGPSQA
jgi:type 1 glutamine amidotransferase